ncbi:sensor histidine kinase [Actinocatenispora rupis]|uniref:histidine kinase n=1 Tax=Actinocatenispora rupis TaxID=519421 RepID=A0A8J3J6Q1_9ACTN|nr:HAMP domain-containing sensor histidine kinase [Actinocatenispora rupis]GID15840.1 putative sensor histidine kinase PhoR [Actinocatenispora rupis]
MTLARLFGRLDRRVPLWLRLVTGVLVLVTATLLVTGYAGSTLLRRHLVAKTGDELRLAAPRAELALIRDGRIDSPPAHGVPSAFGAYLIGPGGRVLERSDPSVTNDRPDLPDFRTDRPPLFRPFRVDGTGRSDWLLLVRPVRQPAGGHVVVAESLAEVDATVRQLELINFFAGIAALAALAIACFWLVRLSLRPVRTIETTAGRIAAGELSQRVPDRGDSTEVGRLGTAVNGMLGRIQTALDDRAESAAEARRSEERMRRFAADASHELRTPITTIRGYAEMYRQQRATMPPDEATRIVGRIEETASRMGGLVDDLLLLAHLDQRRPLARDRVDLTSVAADVALDARALHPDHPVDLIAIGARDAGPVTVTGDEQRLRQVVSNLVGNALKHTPAGTTIEVGVGTETGPTGTSRAVLAVRDGGPGMTEMEAARAFERFYRADPARARAGGGAGLGLAIVGAIVDAHGGTVELTSVAGGGTTVRVTLPM